MSKRLPLYPNKHIMMRLVEDSSDLQSLNGYVLIPCDKYAKNRFWEINLKQDLFDLISNYTYRASVHLHDMQEIPVMPWYFMLELSNISEDEFLLLKLAWPL